MTERFVLGTVQFGLDYGIANRAGRPTRKEDFSILELAYKEGIDTLDTAYSYGESEEIIGKFISQSGKRFNIISKMPDLKSIEVDKYFRQTLARLKEQKIYGYLVHKFDSFIADKRLWDRLESLKQRGLVHKIGVSLYRREELDYLLDSGVSFDILQVPYNIFDQRFEEYFSMLRTRNVEVYVRSVFLQGLFFLQIDYINKRFQSAKNRMEKLYHISENYKIPIHSLCLGFILLNHFIDKVVIGVDSAEQLKENISSIGYLAQIKNIYDMLKSLKFHNEEVVLPYNWK